MTHRAHILALSFLLSLAPTTITKADHGAYCYDVVPGSAAVDPTRLAEYQARWLQLAPGDDGALVESGGVFEETLTDTGNGWQHTQIMRTKTGQVVTENRLLDKQSLKPLSLRRHIENPPAGAAARVELKLVGSVYEGATELTDGTEKPFSYPLATPSFDGWIAGLVIAALPLAVGYQAKLPAVVQLQRSTYLLHLKVRARANFMAASGRAVPVWVVDTDWINIEDHSRSPGGRDESGGTYLIAVEPGNGVPYVVEYANNGGTIRWDSP